MVQKFLFSISFSLLSLGVWSQDIVLINQRDSVFRLNHAANVRLVIDNDQEVFLSTIDGRFSLKSVTVDSLIDIEISQTFLQTYRNQYSKTQLSTIDTIRVFELRGFTHRTPLILLGTKQPVDSIFGNWPQFAEELKSERLREENLEMRVFNSDRLSQSDRKFIRRVKKEYCRRLGVNSEKVKLVYKNEPYKTMEEDFFVCGTAMTREYIDSQNTLWMREQAQMYGLVIQVVVDYWAPR